MSRSSANDEACSDKWRGREREEEMRSYSFRGVASMLERQAMSWGIGQPPRGAAFFGGHLIPYRWPALPLPHIAI